jgi:hypothetical protein
MCVPNNQSSLPHLHLYLCLYLCLRVVCVFYVLCVCVMCCGVGAGSLKGRFPQVEGSAFEGPKSSKPDGLDKELNPFELATLRLQTGDIADRK